MDFTRNNKTFIIMWFIFFSLDRCHNGVSVYNLVNSILFGFLFLPQVQSEHRFPQGKTIEWNPLGINISITFSFKPSWRECATYELSVICAASWWLWCTRKQTMGLTFEGQCGSLRFSKNMPIQFRHLVKTQPETTKIWDSCNSKKLRSDHWKRSWIGVHEDVEWP